MGAIRLVFRFAKKYWLSLLLTVVSMVSLVGAQLLIPWLIKSLVGLVTTTPFALDTVESITRLAVIGLVVFFARGLLSFLRSYAAHIAGWGVVADVRKYVYQHIQKLSLRFYEDKQTGQMMSRVVNDTDIFEALIAHATPDIIVNVLTFVGVATMLIIMSWKLALLSMIPIPLIIIVMRAYSKVVRPAFRFRQQQLGELNAVLNDNISGIREIKAFTREEIEKDRIAVGIDNYKQSLLNALKLMAIFQPLIDFFSSFGTLVVIYFGGILAFNETLPVADLVAFFLYLETFYSPVRVLSQSWERIQEAMASAERVDELIQEEPEIEDKNHPVVLKQRAEGAVMLNDISFRYNTGDMVLQHVTLEIPAHKVVALVGPTGVGKSTLVSLIPRFYDVVEGSITLDGTDIRELSLESLRQQISIVLQDVFLFHGTVRDNILFGRADASEAEMIEAAKIANAHDFIMELPDGYNTLIGERGVKLSGGQKQRLSIARAVLKDAPILILDEATSSVDTETELLIQQALERLMTGRTVIIIAHRLSTVRNADKIVVLEGNNIVEMGSHDQLLAKGGLYHRLYTIQKSFNAA
ncbi:MAG: ABC transporter ATP-binding protein [Anaerolineae bacterium]|jgi:ABC-type multidrug transport system fused ATPase/permease subunit|nr:ABC transporter ATP-binding protein [Anaerolineae bacterium]